MEEYYAFWKQCKFFKNNTCILQDHTWSQHLKSCGKRVMNLKGEAVAKTNKQTGEQHKTMLFHFNQANSHSPGIQRLITACVLMKIWISTCNCAFYLEIVIYAFSKTCLWKLNYSYLFIVFRRFSCCILTTFVYPLL